MALQKTEYGCFLGFAYNLGFHFAVFIDHDNSMIVNLFGAIIESVYNSSLNEQRLFGDIALVGSLLVPKLPYDIFTHDYLGKPPNKISV